MRGPPLNSIDVVPARLEDLEIVLTILREAAEWLRCREIHQWSAEDFPAKQIAASIGRGEVYLARLDEEIIGTVTLRWTDRVIWGDTAGEAGYVHRLAIRRAIAGRGLGVKVLHWAGEAVRSNGRTCLRLDCMADNFALREYYERAGFWFRGEVSGNGWKAARYERRLDQEGG